MFLSILKAIAMTCIQKYACPETIISHFFFTLKFEHLYGGGSQKMKIRVLCPSYARVAIGVELRCPARLADSNSYLITFLHINNTALVH